MASCCPTDVPPVIRADDYKETGTWDSVGDMKVYLSGPSDAKSCVILIYDIFGVHPNPIQISDILASNGFLVIMPDFFRGDPWPMEAKPGSDLMGWIKARGAFDKIYPDIVSVKDKFVKARPYGLVGFCWGGNIAFQVPPLDSMVKAVATVHPSFVTPDICSKIKSAGALILPSKDDPPLLDVKQILESNKVLNHFERFDTMHHGFCCARGDWENPEQLAAATRAIGLMVSHFSKYL